MKDNSDQRSKRKGEPPVAKRVKSEVLAKNSENERKWKLGLT